VLDGAYTDWQPPNTYPIRDGWITGNKMADLNGLLLLEYLILVNIVLAGAALFYWAKPLSKRYNAWTTRLREKSNTNKPPNPKNAQLNFKMMFILFRVYGAFLFVGAGYFLFHALSRLWQ
jgi:hypothetical protein